ncbi:MAG TPA: glycosyltransferase, partial [Burkholderiaceae bacterium]|nr:glycosyltransferase [Burkholderiaceae bacterium]
NAAILPNVVDLDRFQARGPRNDHTARLLVARNLEPLYDNQTALRAFSRILERHPQATLTIAGSGPEEARLKEVAAELGVEARVQFAGRVDRDTMARLYRESDVVLNPSLADNMPNSLLEAMASGVPIVSTNVGGVPFMVQQGVSAMLVPPSDPVAMAEAAIRLLDDLTLWQRLSATGLAEARRYTWQRVAPTLATLYRSALAD